MAGNKCLLMKLMISSYDNGPERTTIKLRYEVLTRAIAGGGATGPPARMIDDTCRHLSGTALIFVSV
jgi:hypothetical protein